MFRLLDFEILRTFREKCLRFLIFAIYTFVVPLKNPISYSVFDIKYLRRPFHASPLKKHWNTSGKRARHRKTFRPAVSSYDARKVFHASRETAEDDLGRIVPEIVFRGSTRGGLFARRNCSPPDGRSYDAAPVSR